MKNLFLLSLSLMIYLPTFGQDAKADFQASSISIFKDGTAFFIKSGEVKVDDGVYRIEKNFPPALSGTFWVTSPNNELSFLSSYEDTLQITQKVVANSMIDLLNANLGQKVRLHIGTDEVLEGIAEDIGRDDPAESQAREHALISLKLDGSWITFFKKEIRRIEFFEQPGQLLEWKKQEVKPVLEVNFTSKRKEQPLQMMYLSKNLNWTPTYLIELIDEEKARLTLRAEVVNNTEDIENTTVNFVVGVPNFQYADRYSSLVNLALHELESRGMMQNRSLANSIQVQSYSTYQYDVPTTSASVPPVVSGLEGASAEDLYFYTLEDMSLKQGGRGQYPVFTANIDIAHIYECNLPQNNEQKNYYRSEYAFQPSPNKVYHSIKVNNSTKYPFTAGPALVVKKDGETKPISQDRLHYTSIKDHSFVKLTEAPDVRIKQAEKAIDRKERVKKIIRKNSEYYYDLITVEGQVIAKNYKNKKIDLNLRRSIIGDLKNSDIEWLKSERINTSGSLNKTTDVCWETSLKAGEELEINYSYQIYVLH
ncbi:MAG: DUF4139 domain-containing protein [Saprospiraceae bacterium]|nr:DUF4139 domain-containing protein [Saprospiraceae bacterium]